MKIFKLLFFLFALNTQSCIGQSNKINGVSFVSSRQPIDQTHVNPIVNVNANYAAVIPFGFIRSLENPELKFNSDRQWYGERKSGAKQYIETLQQGGLKIMLKPQIWVTRGLYTGYIKMNSEANWKVLEATYAKFILEYAQLAENTKVDLFCIGTELEQFIVNRPEFWSDLIDDIKKVYKGNLTYAANWDEFKRTPFWNKLDFIGVDAYFPVSDSKTPTVEECLIGWEPHKQVIYNMHIQYDKPILFTEFGYRSVDYAGREPWESEKRLNEVNLQAQVNTTQALFEVFWNEPWFRGGFIWKWFHNHTEVGGDNNSRFTPQNKPVESIIKQQYGL